jgi:hypothetical protein
MVLDMGIKSWIGLRLTHAREFVGALYLGYDRRHNWSEPELSFLKSLAGQVAPALDEAMRADALRCQQMLASYSLATEGYMHIFTAIAMPIESSSWHAMRRCLACQQSHAIAEDTTCQSNLEAIQKDVTLLREPSVRRELGARELNPQKMHLNERIEEIWQVAQGKYGGESLKLISTEAALEHTAGVEIRLPRLFLGQILERVFDFTFSGVFSAVALSRKPKPTIRAVTESVGDLIHLTVASNRLDLDEDVIRAVNAARWPGARQRGLPLSRARAMLWRLGGDLTLRSDPGDFVLRLVFPVAIRGSITMQTEELLPLEDPTDEGAAYSLR